MPGAGGTELLGISQAKVETLAAFMATLKQQQQHWQQPSALHLCVNESLSMSGQRVVCAMCAFKYFNYDD